MKQFTTLTTLLALSLGHSWIQCTDWQGGEINLNSDWSYDDCDGYARGFFENNNNPTFGLGSGVYDNKAHITNEVCVYDANDYDQTYPPPDGYDLDQVVRILWPAKNHGGADGGNGNSNGGCNDFHADRQDKLYAFCDGTDPAGLSVNTMANGGYDDDYLVIDWQESGTQNFAFGQQTELFGYGFKNCPDFCENTDQAVCYGDFTISEGFDSGDECVFVWFWELNEAEYYTTCWDVEIGGEAADDDNEDDEEDDEEEEDEGITVNSVSLDDAPAEVSVDTTEFDVSVDYSSSFDEDKIVVVDILDFDFNFFGKGSEEVDADSEGTVTVTVEPVGLEEGVEYYLKLSIVDLDVYEADPETAYLSELDADLTNTIVAVAAGDAADDEGDTGDNECGINEDGRVWAQCGGDGYAGETCCGISATFGELSCEVQNQYYFQCLPVSASSLRTEEETSSSNVGTFVLGVASGLGVVGLAGASMYVIRRRRRVVENASPFAQL